MAIIDKLNEFITATEAGAAQVEAVLGSSIDTVSTYGPGGGNQPLWVCVHFTAAGTAGSATTWVLNVNTDADGTFGTSTLVTSRTFTVASGEIAAGKTYYIPLGGGPSRWLRYLILSDSSATADWTTGPSVTIGLTTNPNTALQ